MTSFFLDLNSQQDLIGGKAKNLVKLINNDFPVPPFVVVSPNLDKGIDWSALARELEANCEAWPGSHFAVRSSALDEDSESHSFAGQFETVLGVSIDGIEHAVKKVWGSANSERVKHYRAEQGLPSDSQKPAVIIQALVPSEVSGVAFSKDPVMQNSDSVLISAVYGLGVSLVDGSEDSSNFWVDSQQNITSKKSIQKHAQVFRTDQVVSANIENHQNQQSILTDAQVLKIAELCLQTENYFSTPQDIEWAIFGNELWLLQSRHITTLNNNDQGEYRLWDNSNIAESYCGVTTPLTFSFARHVYEGVYRQFLSILGVTKNRIKSEDLALKTMLGLHSGRIYYNMNSWYQILALLPGFQFNREFMEQMMGVKEGLPDELAESLNQSSRWSKIKDAANLSSTVVKLIWLNARLPSIIKKFNTRFEAALFLTKKVNDLNAEESLNAYIKLESDLLSSWDAPLINDFFAMIFVGVLAKVCDKWVGDKNAHGPLLSASGDIISAEPARRMAQMAEVLRGDPIWLKTLTSADTKAIEENLNQHPEFERQLNSYLDTFSDRCLGELKLESLTLRDDPTTLYKAIAAQAKSAIQRELPSQIDVDALISHLPKLKQKIFRWVLSQARSRVRDRENLRFERTRLFGRVRQLVLNVGEEFVSQGKLTNSRDVFYLDLHELTGAVDGTIITQDLASLVRLRKQEFEAFNHQIIPDRFETHGPTAWAKKQSREPIPEFSDYFTGTGACPGIVTAQVRVVTDPSIAEMIQGEILVAQQTDPGWVMLFPMAIGLLVERGSLLSHSAIVARELGLPAVVSIPHLLSQLKTGDWVRFDGQSGEIWKIDPPQK